MLCTQTELINYLIQLYLILSSIYKIQNYQAIFPLSDFTHHYLESVVQPSCGTQPTASALSPDRKHA